MSSNADDGSGYRVEVLEEVRTEDIPRLDGDVRLAAAQVVRDLHRDPYLGDPTFEAHAVPLPGCRKVRFDAPDERGRLRERPRYRLVYRNEPSDGSVAVLAILAIAERDNVIAYRLAQARLARRGLR